MERLIERRQRQRQFEDSETTNAGHDEGKGITSVGAFPGGASPYNALDMSGNVWEITATVWGPPYPYNPHDGRDNVAAPAPHVLRGGCWYLPERLARCACRYTMSLPQDHFGTRLVLEG
jgi:formylglycine-generating enzyme required for sulfatase activity